MAEEALVSRVVIEGRIAEKHNDSALPTSASTDDSAKRRVIEVPEVWL